MNITDCIVVPAFYLPPISYFKTLVQHRDKTLLIEKFEHFPKQTYRNRASILGANGKLNLYIPVQKSNQEHRPVKDVRINYDNDWQRLHWVTLQTAYRSSAYFEYYEDEFAPFYENKESFLLDFNLKLTEKIVSLLKSGLTFEFTESYLTDYDAAQDFRENIHPKKEPLHQVKPYHQVFSDRFEFMPDLSIVDLLFNRGPQSLDRLLE